MMHYRTSLWIPLRILIAAGLIALLPLAVPVGTVKACQPIIWTGNGATVEPFNWSVASNWTTAIGQGDYLIFPEVAHKHSTNNLTGPYSIGSIKFSDSSEYLLDGKPIYITGDTGNNNAGITSTASSGTNTIALDITFKIRSQVIDVAGASRLVLSGVVQSTYNLVKKGSGELDLVGKSKVLNGLNIDEGKLGVYRVTANSIRLGLTGTQVILSGSINSPSDFSQIVVKNAVNLTNVKLELTAAPGIPVGQTFTLIDNQGSAAVNGTFYELPEGATFASLDGQWFTITYKGGAGPAINDVVITRVATTSTSLSSTLSSMWVGQPTSIIALVLAEGTAEIPVGSIIFTIDGVQMSDPSPLDSEGKAVLVVSSLPAGSHTISALYQGGNGFSQSESGPFTISVRYGAFMPSIFTD